MGGWIKRKDLLDMPEQLDKGAAEGPSAHLTGWEANEKNFTGWEPEI